MRKILLLMLLVALLTACSSNEETGDNTPSDKVNEQGSEGNTEDIYTDPSWAKESVFY